MTLTFTYVLFFAVCLYMLLVTYKGFKFQKKNLVTKVLGKIDVVVES